MSSTLESTHANILLRLKCLNTILNTYNEYQIDKKDEAIINIHLNELSKIKASYEFGSMEPITNYYTHKSDDEKRKEYYRNYMNFIITDNVTGKMKRIYTKCKMLYKAYEVDEQDLLNAFSDYDTASVIVRKEEDDNKMCESCKKPYSIEEKTSEFVCHECGVSIKLYGMVFSDDQFYYQEGQRTKHGKYDPTKHCKFWVDRILARKNVDLPPKLINCIKSRIKRDNIWLEDLTCEEIREFLRDLKMSKWNDHIPLILKTVTGREIEQLTEHEMRLVFMYFSRAINIYGQIKSEDKTNCPYHPFFIYKIIEQILKVPEHDRRRTAILSYIHLQERQTLIDKDLIWKEICKYIPEFEYIPTNN